MNALLQNSSLVFTVANGKMYALLHFATFVSTVINAYLYWHCCINYFLWTLAVVIFLYAPAPLQLTTFYAILQLKTTCVCMTAIDIFYTIVIDNLSCTITINDFCMYDWNQQILYALMLLTIFLCSIAIYNIFMHKCICNIICCKNIIKMIIYNNLHKHNN